MVKISNIWNDDYSREKNSVQKTHWNWRKDIHHNILFTTVVSQHNLRRSWIALHLACALFYTMNCCIALTIRHAKILLHFVMFMQRRKFSNKKLGKVSICWTERDEIYMDPKWVFCIANTPTVANEIRYHVCLVVTRTPSPLARSRGVWLDSILLSWR